MEFSLIAMGLRGPTSHSLSLSLSLSLPFLPRTFYIDLCANSVSACNLIYDRERKYTCAQVKTLLLYISVSLFFFLTFYLILAIHLSTSSPSHFYIYDFSHIHFISISKSVYGILSDRATAKGYIAFREKEVDERRGNVGEGLRGEQLYAANKSLKTVASRRIFYLCEMVFTYTWERENERGHNSGAIWKYIRNSRERFKSILFTACYPGS